VSEPTPSSPVPPRPPRKGFRWGDLIFRGITAATAIALVGILLLLVVVLYNGSALSRTDFGFSFLSSTTWDTENDVYGLLPYIVGTLLTSSIALVLAVPIALGSSIFLTQLAPRSLPGWVKGVFAQMIELLAAIPSIIYGLWGIFVLVPFMQSTVDPALRSAYDAVGNVVGGGLQGADPGLTAFAGTHNPFPGGTIVGFNVLSAGVVLAIMIIPTIAAISRDALAAVPIHQREAALSLGATDWEATRRAVLPYARSGIFGGTMAVLLVIGNSLQIPKSLLSPGQTIASLIANQFAETTGPVEYSALIEAGLVLLVITLLVNIGARAILWQSQRHMGLGRE
jgi:phosphate transport system permease protein